MPTALARPWPERTGGGLDAERQVVLGMPGGLAAELAETLELLDRQRVAGQMQQRVQQHRAVAVGEHEAVAVRPVRVCRVVLAGSRATAPRRCRPCPSARRGGRSWPAARRPWPGRGWRWRVRGVWSCGSSSAAHGPRLKGALAVQPARTLEGGGGGARIFHHSRPMLKSRLRGGPRGAGRHRALWKARRLKFPPRQA